MAVEYTFTFPLPNGLHARPASHFEALATRFKSKIELINQLTGQRAGARSVLSMVGAEIKQGQACVLFIEGIDEQPALQAFKKFIIEELPKTDEALPMILGDEAEIAIPRSLGAAGLTGYVRGKPVSGGIGRGKVVFIGGLKISAGIEDEKAGDAAYEMARAFAAIEATGESIKAKIDQAKHAQEIQVLNAHAAIVRDPAMLELIESRILKNARSAAQAVMDASRSFSQTLQNSKSDYLRERVLDVEDVCMQVLDHLTGVDRTQTAIVLTEPSVCFAEHLTPGQMLALDRRYLKGLVLGDGGTTSHTVILARSMNIPTLVGVARSQTTARAGETVLVDGELGLLVTDFAEPVNRYYAMEEMRIDARRQKAQAFVHLAGITADQHPLEVGANIATADEADLAFAEGAQGIGLFRTEMLFTDRDSAPSEEDQTRIYTAAAKAAQGRPVIIRLLDIGGDKPASYLQLPKEENPFLGYRGVRLYHEFSSMLMTQLRAVLRASTAGIVKILVPMVCCLEEVREIRQMIAQAVAQLASEGFSCNKVPALGVMIEVPSMAFLIPELCRELDFFSIGSNDLIQYFLATDRANPKVSSLYTWSHPAFLRLLKSIVDQVHQQGKWIGLCGEMGDQPAALPLLIGLALDEISVSVPRVTAKKAAISALSFTQCQELLDKALRCSTRSAVEVVLENAPAAEHSALLVSPELIFLSDAASKEEVIKQLADRVYVAGRVSRPQLLEEAIWAREDVYSTGFGHGFSVPHCKSDLLSNSSVVIAKLQTPIEWKSLDGKPVDVVMLLAIRGQNGGQEHMKIIARLSRLVMRDEFRDQIRQENDPARLALFLEQNLELNPRAL